LPKQAETTDSATEIDLTPKPDDMRPMEQIKAAQDEIATRLDSPDTIKEQNGVSAESIIESIEVGCFDVEGCIGFPRDVKFLFTAFVRLRGALDLRQHHFIPLSEWAKTEERDALTLAHARQFALTFRNKMAHDDGQAFTEQDDRDLQVAFLMALATPYKAGVDLAAEEPVEPVKTIKLPMPVIRLLTMQVGRHDKLPEFARFKPEYTAPDGTHYLTQVTDKGIVLETTTGYADFRRAQDFISRFEREMAPHVRRIKDIEKVLESYRKDPKAYAEGQRELASRKAEVEQLQAQIDRSREVVDATKTKRRIFPDRLAGCVFEVA